MIHISKLVGVLLLFSAISFNAFSSNDKDFHPEGDALEHIFECLEYFKGYDLVLGWSIILHDLIKPTIGGFKVSRCL